MCIFLLYFLFSQYFSASIQGKAKKVVQAQNLWFEILKSQIETGTPYMLFKVTYYIVMFFVLQICFCEMYSLSFSNNTLLFIFVKDSCNRKSNQQNLGTIKSSNLCTEIVEYTSPTETAVCNLASIALPRFVRENVSLFSVHKVKMIY